MKDVPSPPFANARLSRPIPGRDHLSGPAEAPLTLVEYGDYECPYCGAVQPVIRTLLEHLGDRLCFAFRNFPLSNLHLHAEYAAESAEAAATQGRFWEMHDLLFEIQDLLDLQNIAHRAANLGLDGNRLIREVLAGVYRVRVREDFRSGMRCGVNDTPTLFVNGVRFDGEPSYEALLGALLEPVPESPDALIPA